MQMVDDGRELLEVPQVRLLPSPGSKPVCHVCGEGFIRIDVEKVVNVGFQAGPQGLVSEIAMMVVAGLKLHHDGKPVLVVVDDGRGSIDRAIIDDAHHLDEITDGGQSFQAPGKKLLFVTNDDRDA